MSESMVERVALGIVKAFRAHEPDNEISWNAEERLDCVTLDGGFDIMAAARAAIAAMREPTNNMMEVYKRAFVSEKRFDGREVYGAMIDAALTPAKVDEASR